jgi:RimJ/RimL family protein N-acetyltransferase
VTEVGLHVLATSRLGGCPLAESDFVDLHALHRDRRVLAWFGAEPDTPGDARTFLDRKLAHRREHGFVTWMFRDPGGAFVDRCGIHRWSLDGQAEVERG